VAALSEDPAISVRSWSRPDYDLDDPDSARRSAERDRPDLVIHCAAWTDVDGCARDPALALRRNATSVGVLAHAAVAAGSRLLVVSTNEVFDGERTDRRGYREDDPAGPRNAYGASKLAGEQAAQAAFDGADGLWIVRTAWLYGPPGNDFPAKIVAAADRLPEGDALPVVADEFGSPTYTTDVAAGCVAVIQGSAGGTFHVANIGAASRLEWAAEVLARVRPGRMVRPISRREFSRASDPPPWGVLDSSRARAVGAGMRDWREAVEASVR